MNELEIPIKKLEQDAILPTKAHTKDAGFDIYSLEDCDILPGEIKKIRTGIAINIPTGHVGLFMDKSGVGSKGLKIFGGVIDAGYTGELIVCLGNMYTKPKFNLISWAIDQIGALVGMCQRSNPPDLEGLKAEIKKGQKITQLVLIENNPFISFSEVEQFEETERGEKGFGSSGL